MHQRVRLALKRQHGDRVLDAQKLREAISKKRGHQDLSVLSHRQLDVYGLHLWAAQKVLGTKLEERDMVIDVTNNATMASCKHLGRSGTMPCLLRTHQYIHTKKARPICGTERMRVQGFCRRLILSGTDGKGEFLRVSQRDLCALAGDTMSVPVMGSLPAAVFSCCLFRPPSVTVTVEEAEKG